LVWRVFTLNADLELSLIGRGEETETPNNAFEPN
jgi:hypothetical protein